LVGKLSTYIVAFSCKRILMMKERSRRAAEIYKEKQANFASLKLRVDHTGSA
jgi:hypothetical protein